MARFGKNYGESLKLCPLCILQNDSQEKGYKECLEINKYLDTKCSYEDTGGPTVEELPGHVTEEVPGHTIVH